ncbi:MAG: alpha/beta hydrolase [Thermoplasmatota archaeon]
MRALRVVVCVITLLLVVSASAVGALSFVIANGMLHPPRQAIDATPRDEGLVYSNVSFRARDGILLSGWWIPARAGTAIGTVVVLHGYGGSRERALEVAPFLHEAHYGILAFDFRGHGLSGGDHTTLGIDETRDVGGAVDWLAAQPKTSRLPIALFGFSMGGATAINAAPALPQVRAVIADSAFASLAAVALRAIGSSTPLPADVFAPLALAFASGLTRRDPGEDDPARAAAQLDRPLFVIQGARDALSPPSIGGSVLCAAAGPWCTLWEVPRAGHVGAIDVAPDDYARRVLAFLAVNLAVKTTSARTP